MSPVECQRRREALGLTTADLARHARLVERTVVRFESGVVQPRPVTMVALRKALRLLEAEAADAAGARCD